MCPTGMWRPSSADGRSRLRAEVAAGGSKFWPSSIRHGSGRPVSDGPICSSLHSDGRRVTRFAAFSAATSSNRCMKLRLALYRTRLVSRQGARPESRLARPASASGFRDIAHTLDALEIRVLGPDGGAMEAGSGENDGIGFAKNFAFGASAKYSSQPEESTTFTSGPYPASLWY